MGRVAFIGDEVTGVGYRLAGADVQCPEPDDTSAAFDKACAHADVVMVTAEAARHIPPQALADAEAASAPLLLIIEDAHGRMGPPDLETEVRNILGLES